MRRPAHDAPGDGAVHTGPDPYAAIHPEAVGLISPKQLTVGRGLPALGSGDARPPTLRPGALDASRLPSRTGQYLRWPGGRVTLFADQQPSSTPAHRETALATARELAQHHHLTEYDLTP